MQQSMKSSTGSPLSTDWYTTHPPRLVCLTRSLIGIWFSSHRKTRCPTWKAVLAIHPDAEILDELTTNRGELKHACVKKDQSR